MSAKSRIVGAVEIGTATIKVLVSECSGDGRVLIGWGECQSRGISQGTIVDFKAASACTHEALMAAEQSAGVPIDYVFLAQTGGHLDGVFSEAAVNVQAANHRVGKRDVETVCELATARELPPGRLVVHNIRGPFRVDGQVVPGSPEDLVGQRLEVGYWIVHGLETKIADNIHVLRGFNLEVRELVLSSLASGQLVTTPEERQNGILAIDLGAGTTDYVLYREGCPSLAGVLPVGGAHLTHDLALGLRLTEGQAEKLKLRHGRAFVSSGTEGEKVWLDGNYALGDRQFPRKAIEQITTARTGEIFEVVKKKLGSAFTPETCAAGVMLTGGTAKLPAIAECAAQVFGVPAYLGRPPSSVSETLRDPSYSTALGLFEYLLPGPKRHS